MSQVLQLKASTGFDVENHLAMKLNVVILPHCKLPLQVGV